jgi:hypothetical protein
MPSNDFAKQYTKLMRDLGAWKKAGPSRPNDIYIFQDLDSNRILDIPIRAFSPKQAVFFLKQGNPKFKYRRFDAILRKPKVQAPKPPVPAPQPATPPPERPVEPTLSQGTLNI